MSFATYLWETLINKREALRRRETARRQQRPTTVKPRLERLEDRIVPSTFVYVGGGANGNALASNAANWSQWNGLNWTNVNVQVPGAQDDLWFTTGTIPETVNGQVVQEQSPMKTSNPCTVDANFGGTVQSLHVDQNWTATITLNTTLTVTTEADIGGGSVGGSSTLNIGDGVPGGPSQYSAVLNWTGGTLGGGGWAMPQTGLVNIGTNSQATISGPNGVTIDGDTLNNYGTLTYNGGGGIHLKDSGQLVDEATMNVQLTAGATIDGNHEANTLFEVAQGATLNINRLQQAGGSLDVLAGSQNNGTVNISQNSLILGGVSTDMGTYSIAPSATLLLVSKDHTLSGATIGGNGLAYIDAPIHISGAVSVQNVDDAGAVVDGAGTLTVGGIYTWEGGTWSGSGVTRIGTPTTGGTLNLAASTTTAYSLQRQLQNYGTVTWTRPADINVSNSGSITNEQNALFDIQVGQQIADTGGAGNFTNIGELRKSAGGDATIGIQFIDQKSIIHNKQNKLHFTNKVGINGSVTVDTGATIAFDGGVEQDAGSTVADAGTITAAGDYVQNGGTFAVQAGTVVANNVDVASGAVFSGYGTVTAGVNNAGEVDADNGTLAVSGAYTQTAGVTNVAAGGEAGPVALTTGSFSEQAGAVNIDTPSGGGTATLGVSGDGTVSGGTLTVAGQAPGP